MYLLDRPCGEDGQWSFTRAHHTNNEIGHIIFRSYSNWSVRLIRICESNMQITWFSCLSVCVQLSLYWRQLVCSNFSFELIKCELIKFWEKKTWSFFSILQVEKSINQIWISIEVKSNKTTSHFIPFHSQRYFAICPNVSAWCLLENDFIYWIYKTLCQCLTSLSKMFQRRKKRTENSREN